MREHVYKILLSLALIVTVGFLPTVAKASSIQTTQGFSGSVNVDVECLEYGKWVPRKSNIPVATNSSFSYHTGTLDKVSQYSDSNMRFVFKFDSSVSIDFFNRSLSFIFSTSMRTPQELGNSNYGFNVYNVNSVFARILTVDGNYKIVPVGFESYTYPSGTSRLDCIIFYSEPFTYCEIVVEFNMYNAFNLPQTVSLGQAFSSDIAFYMGNNTYWSYDSYSMPSVDSPDTDSFPDVDEFLPEDNNPFMEVFNFVVSIPFVTVSMFIVSVVGVVSYVLFGKKG